MRFYKEFNNKYFIQFGSTARLKLTEFRYYPAINSIFQSKSRPYTHLIWWKFSLVFGEFSCLTCKDTGELNNGRPCQECCEHGDYDHGICGICDTNCTDSLAGQAEYYYEGER